LRPHGKSAEESAAAANQQNLNAASEAAVGATDRDNVVREAVVRAPGCFGHV